MDRAPTTFVLGWKEWLALPDLGLPAIKAKIDTGAKTSALHAFQIEPFGPASAPMVRFGVHPVPRRPDVQIFCSAPVVGRREITSSNGEKELRYVISSRVAMGNRVWPVEITLTNREGMAYRMLLGRQAIRDDMVVDPASSYRQPRLSYKRYRHVPRVDIVRRALRIALLTGRPALATNRKLALAADVRGHVLECLDPATLQLAFDGERPGVLGPSGVLGHFDAVVPRLESAEVGHGTSIVRQLELMGGRALNGADALERLANPLTVAQLLAGAGVAQRRGGGSRVSGETSSSRSGRGRRRFLLVGARVVAGLRRTQGVWLDAGAHRSAEAAVAERAASALQLGLAAIDVTAGRDGGEVARISANPLLSPFQSITGALVAEAIIAEIEAAARSWTSRTP